DFQRSDESLGGVLEDFFQAARVTAVAAALDRHAHAVAVHDAGHLRWRQEHRFFLAFDAHESEAGAVGAHDTFGHPGMADACGCARRVRPTGGGILWAWSTPRGVARFSIST